ncbi:DUF2591 family protein [Paraburkholderia sp. SARCC-3016]|uniref:phage protein NinX family protein n=1 Tax=Paraburkholderia sp. SARCC-3016 TaxID=3058611 RepID=UPI002807342D|nr:phage protein NinX family protein [Paraburkholderia sp. SARCC-3016]MDQ7981902.1 DUF2591 family protein [Paraburkholderia sp. SARCC-3016]
MLVADLEGPLLDYWVGRAMGLERLTFDPRGTTYIDRAFDIDVRARYAPSTAWDQGGPVIDALKISVFFEPDSAADEPAGTWTAYVQPDKERAFWGPKALVAAMRAAVDWKFGDQVPDTAA